MRHRPITAVPLGAMLLLLPVLPATSQTGNSGRLSDPCAAAAAPDRPWLSRAGWLALHEQLLSRKDQLRDTRLVFLGDSITARWLTDGREVWEHDFADDAPLNLGVPGDETGHVLWRIAHGELDGIHPRVVVVLIGTNNIGNSGQTGRDTARGVQCVVDAVRAKLPAANILLLAVFPREEQPQAKLRREVNALNARLSAWQHGPAIRYLDLSAAFLDADGRLPRDLFPDGLHLSAAAYEKWAKAMMPAIHALMN